MRIQSAYQNLACLDNALFSSYASIVMCMWKVCARESVLYAVFHMLVINKLCARG